MHIVRILSWVYLILCVCGNSFSQNADFEHFAEEEGLLDADVRAVIKDKEGFMWIGSRRGLHRYDGYACKHFVYDPENPNSIAENNIKCLWSSEDNKIYIGFLGSGFSIYDKRTERFENFSHDHADENSLSHDSVLVFFPGKDGTIWIGTQSGLDNYNPKTKTIERFDPFIDFPRKSVSSITDDDEGNLWVYGPSNQPCKLDLHKKKFIYLANDSINNKPSIGLEAAILHDKEQNLWFGNEWEGLYKYNLKTKSLEKVHLQNPAVRSVIINCLTEDEDGFIWIGTEGAGIYKFNPSTKEFTNYQYIANLPNNLTSNYISCIYESQPGVYWIGTRNFGISIWKRDKKKFRRISNKGEEGKILSAPSVLSIFPSQSGKLLLGTDGGGINLYDPKTHRIDMFSKENSKLCHNSIKSIFEGQDRTVWYGAYKSGLCNINFETGKAESFSQEMLGIGKPGSFNCAWTMCKSYDNKLYIGLQQGGIKVYDLSEKRFVNTLNSSPEFQKLITKSRIWWLSEDSKKRIWIGTEEFGAICYDPKSQQYFHFFHKEDDPFSLKSNMVKVIFEDSRGIFWMGMHRGGLTRLMDFSKRKFIAYTTKDGLPNNNVKGIIEDNQGNLWLSTERGLSCFLFKDNTFRNYDVEDGLQGLNFHSSSSYKAKDGTIYLGGSEGFNIFNPDSFRIDDIPPRIIITDLKIFDESVSPNSLVRGKKYINESIHYVKEITLDHSDDIFSIEFAALDYLSPKKNKYAYKLEGFNENWTYVSSDKRVAMYTNLDPGVYNFRVIASNGDGVWNKEGLLLKIKVLPPFYMTWWFRITILLIVSGFLLLIYWARTQSIRKRNLLLKDEVENRTKELNVANAELKKTAEELQDTAQELVKQNQTSLALYKELTEGLEAAKIIQSAILPRKDILGSYFVNLEVLYKPKELVSGDFYWYTEINDQPLLAVVDCTGHGVAGAFMTFIGYEILNQIARTAIQADPGVILSILNQEILTSMNHYTSRALNIGMDVSMCTIDKKKGVLLFSGANNPLYIVRGEEVIIYKGDRQGVGGKQKREDYLFKTQKIEVEKGDQVYIFTDGFPDQIGGPKGTEKFLHNRFRELLLEIKQEESQERITRLSRAFESWRKDLEQLDDVLVITFDI